MSKQSTQSASASTYALGKRKVDLQSTDRRNYDVLTLYPLRVGMDDVAYVMPSESAYIVRACNAYPALLRIASELVKWEQDPDRYGGDLADLAQEARAALAQAEANA